MLESSYAMDATAQSMIAAAQRLRTEAHQKRETATLVLHYFRNEVATAGEVLLQQSRSRSSSNNNSTRSNRPNNTHKWQQAQTAAATAAAVQAFTGMMNEKNSSNNNYDITSTTTKRKRLTNYGSLAQDHGQQAQTTAAAAVAVATGSTYRSDQSFSNEIGEEYYSAAAAAARANEIEYYNAAAAAAMKKDRSSNNHRHDISRLTNCSNLAQEYGAVIMPPTYSTNPNPNHPHPHGDNQNNTGTPSWGGMSPPSNSRPTSLLRKYPQDSICISNNSISSRCSIPAASPPVQTSFTDYHDPNAGTNITRSRSHQKDAELRDQIDVLKLRQLELLRAVKPSSVSQAAAACYFGGTQNPQATATAIATATSCQPVPLVISPQRIAAPPPSPTTTTTTTRTSIYHPEEKKEEAILVPGPLDVIMGSRRFHDRSGNPYYQALLASHMTRYDAFESNLEKYDFTEAIVAKLRHDGSRFLMRVFPDMLWTEVSFEKAREKVARDFRYLRATQKKDNDNDDSDEEYVPQKGDKWTPTEHAALIRGIARYGYKYKQLATLVPCRTAKGVRRYIQRHSLQQQLRAEGENRDNDNADSEVDTNCVVNKEGRHDEKEEKQKAGTNARANINSENMNDKHNAENPNSSSIIVADTITSHKRLPSLASTTTTTTKFSVKTETALGTNNARSSSASLLAQPCGDYTVTSSDNTHTTTRNFRQPQPREEKVERGNLHHLCNNNNNDDDNDDDDDDDTDDDERSILI